MTPVHILPLGGARLELLERVIPSVEQTIHRSTLLRKIDFDTEQFYDDERSQYNSTKILLRLRQRYAGVGENDDARAIAVVPFDLFIPILTYVFGEAEVNGRVAVVSYYRLAPERYGLAPDANLFQSRFLKEILHELGHVFGLLHCISQECVMHSSSYVEEIDLKGDGFCESCAAILEGNSSPGHGASVAW